MFWCLHLVGLQPRRVAAILLCVTLLHSGGFAVAQDENEGAAAQPVTLTITELRQIEQQVEAVIAQAAPATVALLVGDGASGSGVVVTPDGFLLTAAHVAGPPNQLIQVRFPDGSVATARTLGSDRRMDAALAKLEGDGPWPFVAMAPAGDLDVGAWVVALGHAGGFQIDRPVVARLGRVIRQRPYGVQSDCLLISGDSGGPLFDLQGRVVGIHSRIGRSRRSNFHVPVDFFQQAWNRLLAAEPTQPLLGVRLERDDRGALITLVVQDSAAASAGLRRGDVILAIDGRAVTDVEQVPATVAAHAPGEIVALKLLRDDQTLELEVPLGQIIAP